MTQIENRRKEEGRALVEFYEETATEALPRDVLELLKPYTVVLGKGVHRQAIFRMIDIWPEAHVSVIHRRPIVVSDDAIESGVDIGGWTTDAVYTNPQRLEWERVHETKLPFDTHGGETSVLILPHEGAIEHGARGVSICSQRDQFDKRNGTRIAFRRALLGLSRRSMLASAARAALEA